MQLKDALNVVWEVEASEESGIWHFARNYVLSFAAVLALGFLLLVSLLVAAAGKLSRRTCQKEFCTSSAWWSRSPS